MSILSDRVGIRNVNRPRPIFSLVGLAPVASIPFAPAVVDRPADFPADVLALSAAARDFHIHSEEDEAGGPWSPGSSEPWPTYSPPMGGHTFGETNSTAESPADESPAESPSDLTDASHPIDTLDFTSFDTGYAEPTDAAPFSPSPTDEAYNLAYTLERDGIDAARPSSVSGDPALSLQWSRGRYAAREIRKARLARETNERNARDLLAAYGHGQATGWAGGPKVAPRGYTAAQCVAFHEGYLVGEAEFAKECPDSPDDGDAAYGDSDAYGGQIRRAIDEESRDRRERAGAGEWSFVG